jgi:dimethylhistidine N-methyltransferase
VHAVWADFSRRLTLPQGVSGGRAVAFFPGSSIGNFEPAAAEAFLAGLHRLLPTGSGLLIGVDLIKHRDILEAAYNDAAGVTAEFNLNLLERLRDELGAELDPAGFRHVAFYDAAATRIEMHLESRRDQTIHLGGRDFFFEAGETLHTENSCKYSVDGFQALARRAGYAPTAVWTDPQALFSVHYLCCL